MSHSQYDTPEIHAALEEWRAHYQEQYRKAWSDRSARMAFNRMAKEGWSAQQVEEAIYHSIEMGYRGIFMRPGFAPRQQQDPDVPWQVDTRKGYTEKWVVNTEEN